MSPQRFTLIPAVHLFLLKENQVLLARRFNTGYEDGNYSVPAGHVESRELITTAMIREAREEVGITVYSKDLQFVHVMHRIKDDERVDFFFRCQKWTGTPEICEPEKCDQLIWVAVDKLPENTVLYVKMALQNMLEKKSFSELIWPTKN